MTVSGLVFFDVFVAVVFAEGLRADGAAAVLEDDAVVVGDEGEVVHDDGHLVVGHLL